jgi:hypothetical protein
MGDRRMTPIDQAFFDLYKGQISQCDDQILREFIESQQSDYGQEAFYSKYASFYSHLMDTYIAFKAGIECVRPVKCIVINGTPTTGFKFYGVFKNYDEASEWGTDNFDESGFFVAELKETT